MAASSQTSQGGFPQTNGQPSSLIMKHIQGQQQKVAGNSNNYLDSTVVTAAGQSDTRRNTSTSRGL